MWICVQDCAHEDICESLSVCVCVCTVSCLSAGSLPLFLSKQTQLTDEGVVPAEQHFVGYSDSVNLQI